MKKLENKTAIITGAAKGIGKAVSETFADQGAIVVLIDMDESVRVLEDQLKSLGHNAQSFVASVTDREKLQEIFKAVLSETGRIDILINNAGITRDRTLTKMSSEEWQSVMDVNQTGVFNCTQLAAQYMKNQKYGRIVTAASNVGLRGNYGQTNYVATKSAIIGMTKVWALELARYGITANCIAPGFIKTDMTDQIPDEVRSNIIPMIPAGRMGTPEEIAKAYLFLASDDASYINGICLTVDGGMAR